MESYHILSHRNASCRNGKEQNRTYRVELNWFESEWIGWYRAGSAHGNVETDPSIAVQQALTPLSGFVGRTLLVLFSYIYPPSIPRPPPHPTPPPPPPPPMRVRFRRDADRRGICEVCARERSPFGGIGRNDGSTRACRGGDRNP